MAHPVHKVYLVCWETFFSELENVISFISTKQLIHCYRIYILYSGLGLLNTLPKTHVLSISDSISGNYEYLAQGLTEFGLSHSTAIEFSAVMKSIILKVGGKVMIISKNITVLFNIKFLYPSVVTRYNDCIPSSCFWKKNNFMNTFSQLPINSKGKLYYEFFWTFYTSLIHKKHNLKTWNLCGVLENVTVVYSRVPGSIPARDLCSRTTFPANLGLSSPFKTLHWRKKVKRIYFIKILNWSNWPFFRLTST